MCEQVGSGPRPHLLQGPGDGCGGGDHQVAAGRARRDGGGDQSLRTETLARTDCEFGYIRFSLNCVLSCFNFSLLLPLFIILFLMFYFISYLIVFSDVIIVAFVLVKLIYTLNLERDRINYYYFSNSHI